MPLKGVPSLKQITTHVLAELTAPAPLDEVVRRVLERYPSTAKDPARRVRDCLHNYRMIGSELVFLDAETIAPLWLALQGVRFRVPFTRGELDRGVIAIEPAFAPFLTRQFKKQWSNREITLFDAVDQPLPTRISKLAIPMKTMFDGKVTEEQAAFDLSDWLRTHLARSQDSILVTILNWRPPRLRFEFEAHRERRQADIEKQNRALADMVQTLLDESYAELISTRPALLTAFARLPSARDYPGDHWMHTLTRDKRFFVTDIFIRASEGGSTLDFLAGDLDEERIEEQRFTRQVGAKVYRFNATRNHGKPKRIIEILGRQTLGDFDEVMRSAFDLDTTDHLSEFTRVVPRGKGRKPREQPYGEINPFEPTPAGEIRIAGLGLDTGSKLKYVYDFGDWVEHTLTLERIHDTERGVKYPRVV